MNSKVAPSFVIKMKKGTYSIRIVLKYIYLELERDISKDPARNRA